MKNFFVTLFIIPSLCYGQNEYFDIGRSIADHLLEKDGSLSILQNERYSVFFNDNFNIVRMERRSDGSLAYIYHYDSGSTQREYLSERFGLVSRVEYCFKQWENTVAEDNNCLTNGGNKIWNIEFIFDRSIASSLICDTVIQADFPPKTFDFGKKQSVTFGEEYPGISFYVRPCTVNVLDTTPVVLSDPQVIEDNGGAEVTIDVTDSLHGFFGFFNNGRMQFGLFSDLRNETHYGFYLPSGQNDIFVSFKVGKDKRFKYKNRHVKNSDIDKFIAFRNNTLIMEELNYYSLGLYMRIFGSTK